MAIAPNIWRPILKYGDAGPDVAAWRQVLELSGAQLSGAGTSFEKTTHNATVAWQKAHGLTGRDADGIVGAKTRGLIGSVPVSRAEPLFDPDAIPYVEAANWSRQLGAQPKIWIVLHCMEWPDTSTGAEWCANFFAGREGMTPPKASANYCVDDDSIVCSVRPELVAWHAPGANQKGIGIEHAGFARQTRPQWLDEYSLRMLHRSAKLSAWLCQRFGIPARFVTADLLRRGVPGITTHAECTRAWPEKGGTHLDPGPFFPIREYVDFVSEAGEAKGVT